MPENNWDEEDDEEYEEDGYTKEEKQNCFDLIVASFISNILSDDFIIEKDEDRSELIGQILDVLEEHLDEEGNQYLSDSFLKFEKEYAIQIQTQEIIQSFEWNKNKNE